MRVSGFSTIEGITHHAETILGQVRTAERELTPALVSLVLESVDAVKAELGAIESTQKESGLQYEDLVHRLEKAAIIGGVEEAVARDCDTEP